MVQRNAAEAERWERIAGGAKTLVRSQIEIVAVLQSIEARATPVTAVLAASERFFFSHLRRVDPVADCVVLDFGGDKVANAEILRQPSVTFSSTDGGSSVEFLGAELAETRLPNGAPGLRAQFPRVLLLHQRRAHQRLCAVPGLPLRCIADAGGVIAFEAEIVDLSLGGFGVIGYDEKIVIEPGTLLRGCQVMHPAGRVVTVDIEVRYSKLVDLDDGCRVWRSGCGFRGDAGPVEDLMKLFVLDLDPSEE